MDPGSTWSRFVGVSCHGDDAIGFEFYRREPPELAVTALPVVPDLEVLEHQLASSSRVFHFFRSSNSTLHPPPECLVSLQDAVADWLCRPQSATAARREALTARVEGFFAASDGTYGYRRIHADLAEEGTECSPELVRQIMRTQGLIACQPRPLRVTTDADAEAAATKA